MHNNPHNRNEEKPPYSRLFVVCSKQADEDTLRGIFDGFGNIEDLYIPRDRNTGESKGVAYVKYTKTSAAAAAIQELHMKFIKTIQKPLKVMIAENKNDPTSSSNDEKFRRLFIKVNREVEENEIVDHFSKFGQVHSVHLQRDKSTGTCKGFAYVHYTNFFDTARAYEECDKKYKAVFAMPKDELKRSRNSLEFGGLYGDGSSNNSYSVSRDNLSDQYPMFKGKQNTSSLTFESNSMCAYDTIVVTCSPQVAQQCIERLFRIVPGMMQCQYTVDQYNGYCKSIVTYNSEKAAAYAYENINNFEFPSGEIISIKPDTNPLNKVANNLANIVNSFKNSLDAGNPNLLELADAIAHTSSLIKAASSSKIDQKFQNTDNSYGVPLPPPQPMVNGNSHVAQRCFIVCKPHPPPLVVLTDIFCRFGDLIDVCSFPNKTFGFVKYASVKSAQEAMKTLNGAIIHGTHFKVLEADEKPVKDNDPKMSIDDATESIRHDKEIKRIRLDQHGDNSFVS